MRWPTPGWSRFCYPPRVAPLLTLLLVCMAALAGPAEELLEAVDQASNQGQDAHLVLEIQSTDRRGQPVGRTLAIWQKGQDRRLVRYLEPVRLQGISLLVPDGDTLYLYLPSYGRARRVVGDARGSAFEGSDFAIEDLARMRWSGDFDAELVEDFHLRLTPRPGSEDSTSARIDLHVRPSDMLPARVEHYDDQGELLRSITFSDVRQAGSRPLAHQVTVEDLAHGRTSRATVQEAHFDTGLSDELFTLTHLTQR